MPGERGSGAAMPADVHVALLRGINVGGRNKLPMKTLVGLFEELGCADVRTYIQSGNVVFRADEALAAAVPARISDAIEAELGLRVPVVTRRGAELAAIAAAHPFDGDGVDPKTLHVAFLADRPTAAQVAALDPDRSPGDTFAVVGREVYLHFPRGVARTKLTNAYLDRALDTVSTARNWATVQRLRALAVG